MNMDARVIRMAIVVLVILLFAAFLIMFSAPLFPFIVGGALAYVMYPVVKLLDDRNPWRERWPALSRTLAIITIYVVVAGVITGAFIIVGPSAIRQSTNFLNSLPNLYANAERTVALWREQYAGSLPEGTMVQIEQLLEEASATLVTAGRNIVLRTISAISRALTILIGLAAVPVLLYYLLKDREALLQGFVSWFPFNSQVHVRNAVLEVNGVLASYIRAQLFLGLIVGVMVYIGLLAIGIRFPVWLAIVAGLFELVPIIGPWIGAIPGILVTLATSPQDIFWVILLYFGVQLLENAFLVPRIQGAALGIHPVVIILTLILGSEFAGLWGVVLGPPIVAAVAKAITYFRYNGLEPSVTPPSSPSVEQPGAIEDAPAQDESQAEAP